MSTDLSIDSSTESLQLSGMSSACAASNVSATPKEYIIASLKKLKPLQSFRQLASSSLIERPSLDGHTRYYVPPHLDTIELGRLKFYSGEKGFGFFIVNDGELFFHLKGFRQVVRNYDEIDFAVPGEDDEKIIHNELINYMKRSQKDKDETLSSELKVAFIKGDSKKGKIAAAWTLLPLWRKAENEVAELLYHGIAISKQKLKTFLTDDPEYVSSIELLWKGRNMDTCKRIYADAIARHADHFSENHKPIIVKLVATNSGDTSTDRLQWVDLQTGEPVALAC